MLFTERGKTPAQPLARDDTDMKKWQCQFCSFEYDESLGLPDHGIAAGTRWEDVPSDWSCPDCGASKSDFQMIEV